MEIRYAPHCGAYGDDMVKQTKIERRRLYGELWHEFFRWALAMFLIGCAIAVALVTHFRMSFYSLPLPLIITFFICLFISWVFMFRRRPKNKEFVGDR